MSIVVTKKLHSSLKMVPFLFEILPSVMELNMGLLLMLISALRPSKETRLRTMIKRQSSPVEKMQALWGAIAQISPVTIETLLRC